MRVLLLSDEIAPFSGSGISSRVCGSLSKALRSLDHDVTVVCPLHRSVDPNLHAFSRRLSTLDFEFHGRQIRCALYDGRTSAGVRLIFIEEKDAFGSVDSLEEDSDSFRAAERAAIFGKACAALIELPTMKVDIVHAQSWAGATPFLFGSHTACPQILTLPDPSQHGTFPPDDARFFDLAPSANPVNVVAHTLPCLDHVIASSVGAASLFVAEANNFPSDLRPSENSGLATRVSGILHGIDTTTWNPATDPLISNRYDPFEQTGKASCKASLQHQLNLPVVDDPVLTFIEWQEQVSHLAHGEDIRGVVVALPELLRNPVQIVLQVSSSDPELFEKLAKLQQKWPTQFRAVRSSDTGESHQLLAGSDLVIVSGAPEWSSFASMYAHCYGALPIACQSSRYDDVVLDCDNSLSSGTGFVCRRFDEDDLIAATRRAIAAYQDRKAFSALRTRVMKLDWSWERSARMHESIYRQCRERTSAQTPD